MLVLKLHFVIFALHFFFRATNLQNVQCELLKIELGKTVNKGDRQEIFSRICKHNDRQM